MTGPPTRRTSRLVLRAPRPEDVDPLFAIQGDAETMRFTWCSPSREATAAYLESYAQRFASDGFAPWTAVLADEQRVVGWGGLNRDPREPHWGIEVAYFIDPACWGRGLATELVRASLALAFEELGIPEVRAFARPENTASIRVLAKSGFERVRFVPALERDEFRVAADRSASARPVIPSAAMPKAYSVRAIGRVRSPVAEPVDVGWGPVESTIVVEPELRAGLRGLADFSHVVVVTFLHGASFDPERHLVRRPRGLASMPELGIFAQRAKDRPNPIGISTVELLAVLEEGLRVRGLDAIDGTPVLDVKPHFPRFDSPSAPRVPRWAEALMRDYF